MIKEIGNYLSISKVAQILNVSNNTITRWYAWWEDDNFEKPTDLYLPEYVYLDKRKTKYFRKDTLSKLKEFQIKLNTTHRGVMSKYNNRFYKEGK